MKRPVSPSVASPGTPTVAIIGAGWAGLACAVECVQRGLRPIVFEAAAEVGGRARRVDIDGLPLDNGQHILIGAYRDTLSMMRTVGAEPQSLFERLPLSLRFTDGFEMCARSGRPSAMAMAFLRCRGLSWGDRLASLRLMMAIRGTPPADETVAGLFARTRQTATTERYLWAPLCIAALNTGVTDASAHVFAQVLRDTLTGPAGASDVLLPRGDLGQLFPAPAAAWLSARGASVRCGTRVRAVQSHAGGFSIDTADGVQQADRVVIATSPHHLPALLRDLPGLDGVAARAGALEYEPVTTVFAAFGDGVALPAPMMAFADGVPHWIFDRGALGGPAGLIASVVSADGARREDTERAVIAALRDRFPALPAPLWVRTITEKRATFRCTPGRPAFRQPDDVRIALAGDYLLPDYPATLESAVRSGQAAARRITGEVTRRS
ncbi:MAG: hydroxysqualene dehydroxylase HpnE [Methyloversatilis sp.]|jgi:squalene-associated FAD-dependent desaturase|nr:hydroxysqualene dehydroxylase HpnE [Methyloversatilis sp.]